MLGQAIERIAEPGEAPDPRIRLLIVDDSAVARAVLARMIAQDPVLEIVDAVPSAADALERLAHERVDVILLDLEMPGRTGIAALPDLIAMSRGARVLVVSALAEEGAAASIEALALGAADTLAKPGKGSFGGRFAQILCERLVRLGRAGAVPLPDRTVAREEAMRPLTRAPAEAGAIDCLAIGGSTGGVHALFELLRALPTAFGAPILVTQHLPAAFMPFFADQLQANCGRKAVVARDGMALQGGRLHIAPGDAHLCVERHGGRAIIHLSRRRVESGCLPSVDPMFDSVAAVFGARAVGVVLSGMGRDGALGAEALAAEGADILVQTIDSSVVWGMPGSVAKAGLATATLAPAGIAGAIGRRAGLA